MSLFCHHSHNTGLLTSCLRTPLAWGWSRGTRPAVSSGATCHRGILDKLDNGSLAVYTHPSMASECSDHTLGCKLASQR